MTEEKKEVEDYDFDFSIYEDEEAKEEVIETIDNLKRPNITGFKSRFSMGESEFIRISELRMELSKLAIKVETRTQEISVLWKFYGHLSEVWEITRNIYGELVNKEIQERKNICRELMQDHSSGTIPHKVHNNLLFLRSQIYRLHQIKNLSIEVDRIYRSGYSRAKRKITE